MRLALMLSRKLRKNPTRTQIMCGNSAQFHSILAVAHVRQWCTSFPDFPGEDAGGYVLLGGTSFPHKRWAIWWRYAAVTIQGILSVVSRGIVFELT